MPSPSFQIWRELDRQSMPDITDLQQFTSERLGDGFSPINVEDVRIHLISRYAMRQAIDSSPTFANMPDHQLAWEIQHNAPKSFRTSHRAHVTDIALTDSGEGLNIGLVLHSNALRRDVTHIAKTCNRITKVGSRVLPEKPIMFIGHVADKDYGEELTTTLLNQSPEYIFLTKAQAGRYRNSFQRTARRA